MTRRVQRQVVAGEMMRSAFSGILTRREAAAINATDRRARPHALKPNKARRGARLRRLAPVEVGRRSALQEAMRDVKRAERDLGTTKLQALLRRVGRDQRRAVTGGRS